MGGRIIQDEEVTRHIEELVVSNRSSTMLVCAQGTEKGEVYGETYSCYLKEPIWFNGVGDMMLKLDEIRNWVSMPYTATDPCFLNMRMERRYRRASSHHPQADKSSPTYTIGQTPFKQVLKAREVLIVHVKYRQLSSLRGSIRGKITEGEVVDLKSTLELMRMTSTMQP